MLKNLEAYFKTPQETKYLLSRNKGKTSMVLSSFYSIVEHLQSGMANRIQIMCQFLLIASGFQRHCVAKNSEGITRLSGKSFMID